MVLEYENKYLIPLDKLFAGVTSSTSSSESTVIRAYQDFKKSNELPEFYSADELIETCYDHQPIMLYCIQLLENAINRDSIDPSKEINRYFDIYMLEDVLHDEEKLHQFLYKYFQKIELPEEL